MWAEVRLVSREMGVVSREVGVVSREVGVAYREGKCHTKEKERQGQRWCGDKEGGIQL